MSSVSGASSIVPNNLNLLIHSMSLPAFISPAPATPPSGAGGTSPVPLPSGTGGEESSSSSPLGGTGGTSPAPLPRQVRVLLLLHRARWGRALFLAFTVGMTSKKRTETRILVKFLLNNLLFLFWNTCSQSTNLPNLIPHLYFQLYSIIYVVAIT